MELRALGNSGIRVSPLGLGSVKLGRNREVKYPQGFQVPNDRAVSDLLALARDLGINLIDTAPAYGSSEERLGRLLPGKREDWVIVTKVGEQFIDGCSHFDFSTQAIRRSVESSLRRLNTDYLDVVLIHSDGNDLKSLQEDTLGELRRLQVQGKLRATGISGKTVEGGLLAAELLDVLMVTCNLQYNEELPVLQAAQRLNRGVLIKKGLMSGHVRNAAEVEQAMAFVFSQPGVSSMVVGTINPGHLEANVVALQKILDRGRR
jgi:aryl-alcohol dehydrogenase-like predicted oxidoreductase